jgi:hypothetical protein
LQERVGSSSKPDPPSNTSRPSGQNPADQRGWVKLKIGFCNFISCGSQSM